LHVSYREIQLEAAVVELIYPPPRTVAVLGWSDRMGRPSREVALALSQWGYRVIPVNPGIAATPAQPVYPTLEQVPVPIDIVDVFRRSEHVRQHQDDILLVRPRLLWLQDGVTDEVTAEAARQAGITVVQDDCLARRIAGLRAARGD
jgi:predicted CoA-binding protein